MTGEIVIWDGRGSVMFLANHAHVHSPEGKCLKNRDGDSCE